MLPECPDQSRCLHLTSSAGLTRRVDGPFRRFPLGARKVGEVALTRARYVVRQDLAATGLAEPAWLETHRIQSFAALPILMGERCLGVLALFSRRELAEADLALLEGAARCAGALVSGARERASREIVRPRGEPAASADPTGDPGGHEAAHARRDRARGDRARARAHRRARERTARRGENPRDETHHARVAHEEAGRAQATARALRRAGRRAPAPSSS